MAIDNILYIFFSVFLINKNARREYLIMHLQPLNGYVPRWIDLIVTADYIINSPQGLRA